MQKIYDLFQSHANDEKAKILLRFFKTGKGEYGEGDQSLGIMVPAQRKIAKQLVHLSFSEIEQLLLSKIHEHRLTGLLILTYQFTKADATKQKAIHQFYLDHTSRINNWDLVDVTCPLLVGAYLFDKDRRILYHLAKSSLLWERRIAIVSTLHFIRKKEFSDTFQIAEILLHDTHDLIHKAVGWMLREVGKKDEHALELFLDKHATSMPRTMLRYAIERFDEVKRKKYLARV